MDQEEGRPNFGELDGDGLIQKKERLGGKSGTIFFLKKYCNSFFDGLQSKIKFLREQNYIYGTFEKS
jgi:hypothetical protein